MSNSKIDEKEVEKFLKSFGLRCQKIDDIKNDDGTIEKAPDFKVIKPDEDFFFCEVKSIFTEVNENGFLHSKLVNIISTKVHKSIKQFNSVNPKRVKDNVLVWVTHTMYIDWNKFVKFCLGGITIPLSRNGKYITHFNRFEAFNRVRDEMAFIDLSIWLFNSEQKYIFTGKDFKSNVKLMEIFNIKDYTVI